MTTYTITIKDKTNKARYLLGLIREIAKTDKKNITLTPSPNRETIKAIIEADNGKVVKTSGKKDFFNKLNS